MQNRSLRKPNVLAVDDQRANLTALDAVLGADCNMVFAGSGPAAIDILKQRQDIDVILMDVQMPGMDGFEAAAKIKRMDGCEDIPVVFITAVYNEDPFIKQGYKVGGVDYFSKPFDPEILKIKVGIYASFRQRADLLRERERQIRESEELQQVGRELSKMLNSLSVGVIVVDRSGRVCQTNEEVLEVCRPNGRSDWWDADGQLVEETMKSLSRALLHGDIVENEYFEIPCPSGSSKTILCSASTLRGLDGAPLGAAFMVQDFTDRMKIEKDLEQRIAKLVAGAEIAA